MPRLGADERLRRLLALVPWVAAHDGPTVAEVCARFGCTERDLAEDLELLFVCGLYPYTPDMLIETDITDDRVWIRYAEYFSRPLRLTPGEGVALLASGRTVLAGPGADPGGPLARGMAKLAGALGLEGDDPVEIELGEADTGVTALLRQSVEDRRRVEIDYYSYGRDELTTRSVDPYAVFSAGGQWYVSAWCHMVHDERLFRLDRIRRATPLDVGFEPSTSARELSVYEPRDGDPRVVLELDPAARWVVEQYPVEKVEERTGGRVRLRLAVSERPWLERLLLRVGPHGRVVEGDDPSANAAGRLLARYR